MAHSGQPRFTKVPEIRKGDTVVVLGGKDAGKRGVVDKVFRDPRGRVLGTRRHHQSWDRITPLAEASVVVTGLNIAKRHTKARPTQTQSQSQPQIQPGGILDIAAPIPLSRVMVVCPRCDKPTRIRHEVMASGQRVRVCSHCSEPLEAVQ